MKSIYVGNLHYKTTLKQLQDLFAQFGEVGQITMVMDKNTKKFKGYAFVQMSDNNAECAISHLHGDTFLNRILQVKEANKI